MEARWLVTVAVFIGAVGWCQGQQTGTASAGAGRPGI